MATKPREPGGVQMRRLFGNWKDPDNGYRYTTQRYMTSLGEQRQAPSSFDAALMGILALGLARRGQKR